MSKTTARIVLGLLIISTAACDPSNRTDVVSVGQYTLSNWDKTLWNVTDTPTIGTVVLVSFNGQSIVSATKYSDPLSTALSADLREEVTDYDQTDYDQNVKLSRGADASLGLGILKLIGINLSATASRKSEVTLRFSGVKVSQFKEKQAVTIAIQDFDSGRKPKNAELASLLALVNDQKINQIRSPERSRYWVITKVFTPSSVAWTFSAERGAKVSASCGADPASCGKIDMTAGNSASGEAAAKNRPLFVVLKPLYVDGANVRVGEILPSQAPKAISG